MEVLLRIEGVEIWQGAETLQELSATDTWSITSHNGAVTSRIGSVSWKLESSLHCLKGENGTYVFAINPQESLYYCLKLPPDAQEDDVVVLEATLEAFTAYNVASKEDLSRTDKLVDGIGRATSKAVTGITVAAQYVGDTIAKGAERYKSKREACKDPKPVSEKTKKRVERVSQVARMASGMASAAVEAVSVFTSKAADTIIGDAKPKDAEKATGKAKRVAAAVVISAADIYDGMVEALKIVSQKTADATKEVVTHKFGEDAGQVSYDGMQAVGHSANAVIQSTRLGTKAVLKSTAKKTAVAYMQKSTSGSESK